MRYLILLMGFAAICAAQTTHTSTSPVIFSLA